MSDMPTVVAAPFVSEDEGKRRFALMLLQNPGDIYKVAHDLAYSVGIYDAGQIKRMADFWPHDPLVKQETERLTEERGGPAAFLPSKEQVANALWKIADASAVEAEVRIKAMKEYSTLMGYIGKEGGNTIVLVNKVMQVRDMGDDEEWERKAAAQQRRIIDV